MYKPARSFQDLIVWQRAHALVLVTYKLTRVLPKHELFGLISQAQRAAVSIAANIAEGFRKMGTADKARFLNIAQGSLEELRYYLILIADLGYADTSEIHPLLEEVSKLLDAYLKRVLASIHSPQQ